MFLFFCYFFSTHSFPPWVDWNFSHSRRRRLLSCRGAFTIFQSNTKVLLLFDIPCRSLRPSLAELRLLLCATGMFFQHIFVSKARAERKRERPGAHTLDVRCNPSIDSAVGSCRESGKCSPPSSSPSPTRPDDLLLAAHYLACHTVKSTPWQTQGSTS